MLPRELENESIEKGGNITGLTFVVDGVKWVCAGSSERALHVCYKHI
jgi:hypothetical protein